jgi:hypothetical protein
MLNRFVHIQSCGKHSIFIAEVIVIEAFWSNPDPSVQVIYCMVKA